MFKDPLSLASESIQALEDEAESFNVSEIATGWVRGAETDYD